MQETPQQAPAEIECVTLPDGGGFCRVAFGPKEISVEELEPRVSVPTLVIDLFRNEDEPLAKVANNRWSASVKTPEEPPSPPRVKRSSLRLQQQQQKKKKKKEEQRPAAAAAAAAAAPKHDDLVPDEVASPLTAYLVHTVATSFSVVLDFLGREDHAQAVHGAPQDSPLIVVRCYKGENRSPRVTFLLKQFLANGCQPSTVWQNFQRTLGDQKYPQWSQFCVYASTFAANGGKLVKLKSDHSKLRSDHSKLRSDHEQLRSDHEAVVAVLKRHFGPDALQDTAQEPPEAPQAKRPRQ